MKNMEDLLDCQQQRIAELEVAVDARDNEIAELKKRLRHRQEIRAIEHFAYGIDEAREVLGGLGRNTIYQLITAGEIRTFRLGNRRLISADALRDFVKQREEKSQS